MGWNADLESLLAKLDKVSKQDSLITRDVTGAVSIDDEPDTLFYTVFSEESAKAFSEIFDNYKQYKEENIQTAIESLRSNIEAQCKLMEESGETPLEILLFSSRIIKDEIASKPKLQKMLISIIRNYLEDNPKSVHYILNGWEWTIILYIVLVACGETNSKDIVEIAMHNCKALIKKFVNSADCLIAKGYIDLIIKTQDKDNIHYFGDIFSVEAASQNNELQRYFLDSIKSESFVRQNSEEIIEAVTSANIPYQFRNVLGYITNTSRSNTDISSTLNSQIDFDKKVEIVRNLDFECEGTANVLNTLQSIKDHDLFPAICEKLLDGLDNEEINYFNRSRAFILIGQRGAHINGKAEIVTRLQNAMSEDESFAVPITIALYELWENKAEDVLSVMSDDESIDVWGKAVGRYFKNRRLEFVKSELFLYADSLLAFGEEDKADKAIRCIYAACKAYNSDGPVITDDKRLYGIDDRILNYVGKVVRCEMSEDTVEDVLSLLELVFTMSPSRATRILGILDDLHSKFEDNASVSSRIDRLIGKVDVGSEPEQN